MVGMDEQNRILASIRKEQEESKERILRVELKLEPVYKVFESVTGFNSISVWILKGLVLIGAGIGVVYGFIKFLKN